MEHDGRTGERIAAARREAHLTQRALAGMLGVTVRTLQNYESGKIVPYRHLDQLQRHLDRSASWMLTGRDYGNAAAAETRAETRRQLTRLRQNVQQLETLRDAMLDQLGS